MEIIHPGQEDYHIHSATFSDGLNTIDELVHWAGIFGLKKIAITDHSQASLDRGVFGQKAFRDTIKKWKNVHNSVEVIFGVEGDLLNEDGDICCDIHGVTSDFLILSAHREIYEGNPRRITEAYLKAIERYGNAINFLGHPCINHFEKYLDMDAVIATANERHIPMEFSYRYLATGQINLRNQQRMLENAERVYVNSDAHTLYELKTARELGFNYLSDNGYI